MTGLQGYEDCVGDRSAIQNRINSYVIKEFFDISFYLIIAMRHNWDNTADRVAELYRQLIVGRNH